jgi:hypothetical protein
MAIAATIIMAGLMMNTITFAYAQVNSKQSSSSTGDGAVSGFNSLVAGDDGVMSGFNSPSIKSPFSLPFKQGLVLDSSSEAKINPVQFASSSRASTWFSQLTPQQQQQILATDPQAAALAANGTDFIIIITPGGVSPFASATGLLPFASATGLVSPFASQSELIPPNTGSLAFQSITSPLANRLVQDTFDPPLTSCNGPLVATAPGGAQTVVPEVRKFELAKYKIGGDVGQVIKNHEEERKGQSDVVLDITADLVNGDEIITKPSPYQGSITVDDKEKKFKVQSIQTECVDVAFVDNQVPASKLP